MLNKIYLDYLDIYQNAKYEVLSSPSIAFKIGEMNQGLEDLLVNEAFETAALITACNPKGIKQCHHENQRAMEDLKFSLNEMKLPFLQALGSDPKGAWKEESYLILGIALDQAETLGRQFQQNAFVWIETGHAPSLVWP
jgi:Protein of unknown function (DUF3293)